jgi:AcrR family transcriptional regulator
VTASPPARSRRRYDSALRREGAARTRESIVTAAAEILRRSDIRDWRGVTIRAVAARAGINERTVYRHFDNEQKLRDAVMHRLEVNAGIDLTQMRLEDIGDVAARIFRHVSSYPLKERPSLDPTLADANRRQHEALLNAVALGGESCSVSDQTLAAAMFDVLWGVASYERLVLDWHLEPDEAVRALRWAIGLIEAAIREGACPPRDKQRAKASSLMPKDAPIQRQDRRQRST